MKKTKIPNRILICFLCGCLISKEFKKERTPTREHLVAKSKLKKGEKPLIRYACYDCNQKKKNDDLYDFVNEYENINVDNFLKRNANDNEVIKLYHQQESSR